MSTDANEVLQAVLSVVRELRSKAQYAAGICAPRSHREGLLLAQIEAYDRVIEKLNSWDIG